MRTPARPRLPDGDCVFISDVRIVAHANTPVIPADMTWLGLTPPRRALAHIALIGFETVKNFEFRNRKGPNDGLGRPQYVGSSAIVYAEHEVVFLQSDQADRAISTWIDILLHMNPLMRVNEDYKDDRAGSAWGSERGLSIALRRPWHQVLALGGIPRNGSKDLPSIDNARLYPYSVSLLLRYSASLSFNSRVSRLSLALKTRVRTARMAR